MRLNTILAKRETIAAAKYAQNLQRATRPLPQYPNADASLRVAIAWGR